MSSVSDHTLPASERSLAELGARGLGSGELALEPTVSTGPMHDGEAPHRGGLIDRYVVLDLAGAGAMGMVLAAYDPQLDRKIAVKVLKIEGHRAQLRLQREAQALAKLVHPNVVAIFDVGTHEGRLFIAMEYVEGQTLGRWMAGLGSPRPWRDIVAVFSDAGRGLAAAHAAGLVHRDFKPENVMLGRDGRPRVMDFGLARAADLDDLDELPDDTPDELEDTDVAPIAPASELPLVGSRTAAGPVPTSSDALHRSLTQTGAMMGTPAYMSPEQFRGQPADAASDQFGFCIALYEALYGERPFTQSSLAELLHAVEIGIVEDPPPGSTVPPWVRKILLRGLAPAPADRWPSMDALLAALANDPSVRRRKWIAGALGVGALAAAVFAGVVAGGRSTEGVCEGLDDPLVGVWDDERRTAIEDAFAATEQSYAAGTWDRVEPQLDTWASAWTRARAEACEATARGAASAELLDLRMACLDEQLTHLSALVAVFAEADAPAVERAVDAVARLPPIDACADTAALLAGRPERDPETAEAVVALGRRLIEAETRATLGQPSEALAAVEAIAGEAEALDDPRLAIDLDLSLGLVQQLAGEFEAAEGSLRRAYRAALIADLDDRARSAASRLVMVTGTGSGLAKPEQGRAWAFHAGAFIEADGSELEHIVHGLRVGEVEMLAGEYDTARAHYERALARAEALDPDHIQALGALTRMANLASLAGQVEDSITLYERALAQVSRTFDPTHPNVGALHLSLGEVLSQAQRYAEARVHLEAAVGIYERALGPRHARLGSALATLGYNAAWLGEFASGRDALERAATILADAVGTEHYAYADVSNKRGVLELEAGQPAAAAEHYERARAAFESVLGPEHPNVGIVLVNLAELAESMGEHQQALERLDAGMAILGPKIGADSPDLLVVHDTRAAALEALGRADEAAPIRAQAAAIRKTHGLDDAEASPD